MRPNVRHFRPLAAALPGVSEPRRVSRSSDRAKRSRSCPTTALPVIFGGRRSAARRGARRRPPARIRAAARRLRKRDGGGGGFCKAGPRTSTSISAGAGVPHPLTGYRRRRPARSFRRDSGAYSMSLGFGRGPLLRSIDQMGDGVFRKVRRELGVAAFGVNALVLAPGVVSRPHFHDEQDELYFVHRGRARFDVAGTRSSSGRAGSCTSSRRRRAGSRRRRRGSRAARRRREGRLRRPRRPPRAATRSRRSPPRAPARSRRRPPRAPRDRTT